MGITPKQERFVQEYLIDYNGKQAAIRAGYSANAAKEQASRLLTYANVSAAIKVKRREIMKQLDLKAEDVLHDFVRLKDACLEPDENGKPRDATNAVRCLSYLGSHLGLWKKEAPDDDGVEFRIIRSGKPETEELDENTPENVVKLPA